MIEATYPSTKPKVFSTNGYIAGKWYTPQEHQQAAMRSITPEEYRRRDDIVREQSNQVKLQTGDTAYPHNKEGYEKYGSCIVVGITRSYKEFPVTEKWKKNDMPYVMSFRPLTGPDKNSIILCTHQYLVKTLPDFQEATTV
jgi:hypothetical protein